MAYFGENLPIYREFEGGMLVVERLDTVIDFCCAEDLRERVAAKLRLWYRDSSINWNLYYGGDHKTTKNL